MAKPDDFGDRGLPPAVDGLFRLSAALTQRLNQHLHDACNLSLAQYQFLWIVAAGPVTLGDLASALGCTRGNVTGLADRLIDQGLVVRRQDPDDRRVVYVEATRAGRKRLDDAGAAVKQALRGVGVDEQLEALHEALLSQAAGVQPPADTVTTRARPYPRARPSRQGRMKETPVPSKQGANGSAPAVRVTGGQRRVIVVRDDQVVHLDRGGPLAE